MVLLVLSTLLSLLSFVVAGNITAYAPNTDVACPSTPLLREFSASNQTLNQDEVAYISAREAAFPDAWKDWLGDGSELHYDLSAFTGKYPRIGIALSGGGYRAAQYGAGVLSALDSRNDSAKAAGTGGLLQVASYLSGLSGGSWLTGSLYLNDWPTLHDLALGNGNTLSGWLLDHALFTPDGIDIFSDKNTAFYGSILASVLAKAAKGLDTSITDPWARAISYHFLNQTTPQNFFTNDSAHGAGQLWSEIPFTTTYQQHNAPFPLVVVDSRPVGSNLTIQLSLDPIVYEVSPLEFGSFDPNLSAMVNLSFAGTHLLNGRPDNSTGCITGFDQAGFVMGTSSSLFNMILDDGNNEISDFSNGDAQGLIKVFKQLIDSVRTRNDDVAIWPNPFDGLKASTFEDSNSSYLELIDGGSNLENVPFGPLFVKSRAVDVIIGVDGSADIPDKSWPNGTAPIFTSERLRTILQSSHQQFPPIPATVEDFVSTGVNMRPTLFGCDPTQNPPEYPLVIYLPNSPPLTGADPVTNSGTFTLFYTRKHTQLFLDQAHANTVGGFTPNTTSPDPQWPTCLKCAAVDRTRLKLSPALPRSDVCAKCFQQYCYDPKNPPSKAALPNRKLDFKDPDEESFYQTHKGLVFGLAAFGALMLVGLVGACVYIVRKVRRRRKGAYAKVVEIHDDSTWHRSSEDGVLLDHRYPPAATTGAT